MHTLGSHIVGVETDHADNAGLACLLVGLSPTDGGGTLYDLTGNTPGATLINGATWAGTPFGQQGLSFSNAVMSAFLATTPPADFSIATWARVTTTAGTQQVVFWGSAGSTMQIELRAGTWRYGVWGGTAAADSGVTPAVGRWYRIVATKSGGAGRIYLDGVLKGSGTGTMAVDRNVRLGGYLSETLSGSIAGVQFLLRTVDDGWAARDYEWSQDPNRDPRLRRTSTRSVFGVAAAGVPSFSFVPAFAPGWGW